MPPEPVDDSGSPNVHAVLWDLDGTLIDSEGHWLAAEEATMAAHGLDWTKEDQQHCLGGPMERVTQYMGEQIAATTGKTVASGVLADELLTRMSDELINSPPSFSPGAKSLLAALTQHGIPMALVTASHRQLLDALAHSVDLHAFTTTIAGDEVERTKPDPMPYLEAARRLGVNIKDCVVLEDSPTGVAAAQASGAMVVAIPHMADISPGPRRHIVSSVCEISVDWLNSLMRHEGTDGKRDH